MPKLPGIGQRAAVRALEKVGFQILRQSGHIIMIRDDVRLIIPRHNPINALTMGTIARDAGLTPDEFRRLL